jgi:hypothetical protein
MQSALIPAVNMASAAMSALPAVFEYVNSAIVGSITFVEVVIGNFPAIVEAAVAQAELYWIQFSESVKHILTTEIPAYLEWFGNNWTNLLTDIFSAGLTIVQNYIKNYGDVLLALWDWVSSGFAGGAEKLFMDVAQIANRNLLEGFEATTEPLPDIIARQLTDREQELAQRIGKIGTSIGEEFANKFADRMESVNETFKDFNIQANLTANEAIETLGKVELAKAKTGTTATQSRLLTRGPADRGMDKVAKNTEKTVSRIETLTEEVQKLQGQTIPPRMEFVG